MCPHVSPAEIEADRENLKDSVFRIKHGAEWLYDAGDSMISLEHVRALVDNPPAVEPGSRHSICGLCGAGAESVLATCERQPARDRGRLAPSGHDAQRWEVSEPFQAP